MKRFIENRPSSDTARRPLPPLAGNLLFLGALFAMSLLVMAIEKPLFLLWYHAQAAEASAAELALVVWNGLKLDQTVAGYITALPLLVVLAALWIPGRWSRSVLKGYLLVIAAVAATAFAANLALYEYWAFPLDSSVLQYLASPKEALASVTAGQLLLQLLVAAAVFGGMAWCYLRVLRLYDPARRSTHRAGSTLVLLLAAGVLFLPIRGGVSVATANVSKVYFSGRMFLNHAAVNPLFSFLSTLSDGDDALYEYEFFPEPERAAIFEPLRGDLPAGIGTDTLLRTRRPNVVLFLVESFGRSTVDERVGGEPVAPEFQRLKGEGVYFDNLFANSFRTDRGTVAVLSGFPAQTKMSVMKLPVKSQRLPSIARSLRREGYATSFYYGGDLNFTNTASYLYGTGFDRLTWQKDLHFDAPTSKWGYADDVVIDAFTDHVLAEAASQRPFFAAMLTLSSHEPFDVPFAKFDDPMLNAMAFTDACLGRFVERVRQTPVWDDLLVILIADHAYPYPYGIANSDALRHRIPMLWLGGAVRRPAVVETYGSQSDLAATLLAQLGIAHGDFLFSRDLFDPARPKFGYWCFNNGFGVADAGGTTIFDCTSARVISPDSTAAQLRDGKAMLQTTYKAIREL
ncbi:MULTISPECIES: LTA synthase family protein [Alistipes]|uniref:Sulfatase n=1 Tax=Alistipes communis TaxID=2585118 RepID=A0A4Y1WUG8_9BACT|nr:MULTISPECIES: LTA synthase family protein [Alistipes]MBS5556923.1 LTA synthase family protein [Alistipes sp.]BBL03889.1 sulfatase [Alistipes communis]HJG08426.1 LTA synthase family protein [Alistipes communis]